MCASLLETGMEIKCAKVERPPTYTRLEDIPGAKAKSIIPVLHRDGHVDGWPVKNAFKFQQVLS